jgi:hypothetical protein
MCSIRKSLQLLLLDFDPEVDLDPEEGLGAGNVVDAVPPFINAATLLESSLLSIT